jgi:hypothetical protein
VVLIAAPRIFQLSDNTAATVVPIVLGVGLIVYSLFTDYELGVARVLPMPVHLLFDIAAGTIHALSPWIFGFADESFERLGAASARRHRRRRARARDSEAPRGRARRRARTARPRAGRGRARGRPKGRPLVVKRL